MVERNLKINEKKGGIFVERKERGITLISLVLTIIVMLILVAVSINVAVNGGLFSKAGEAVKKTDIAKLMEDWMVERWGNHTSEADEELNGRLSDYFGSKYPQFENDFKIEDGKLVCIGENEETKQYAKDLGIGLARICNVPKLMNGMTPIKWVGNEEKPTTKDDPDWYDYTNKQWANAKTTDGSYWVWIPRFAYRINEGNYHKSTAGTIDIKFLKNTTNTAAEEISIVEYSAGTTFPEGYVVHPAFKFGDKELEGFWVAKFEASNSGGNIKIVPGVKSWRSISVNDIFTKCKNYDTTKGSHMMKNSEWGAVAYLAQSQYGKNDEVWINNSSSYITGNAGNSVSASSATGTTNAYNTGNGPQASTTGNVTGIYDMSGGAWEYVAAYVNNNNGNLAGNGNSLYTADAKYKDVYTKGVDTGNGNYTANSSKYGDAVYETSTSGSSSTSWHSDYSNFPCTSSPFFLRGDYSDHGDSAGLFCFGGHSGVATDDSGFRPVLATL